MRGKIAPYFPVVCRDELSAFLQSEDLGRCDVQDEPAGVLFRYSNCFLEVSYYPEDFPDYHPMINIGKYDDLGNQRLLGLWSLIPSSDEDRNYSEWIFTSESQLRSLLTKLKVGVIPRFALALIKDTERLEQVLREQENEREAKFKESLCITQKRQAAEAFQARRYRDAVALFEAIPTGKRSALEQKRYKYAKLHL